MPKRTNVAIRRLLSRMLARGIVRELADAIPQALWISESGTLFYVNPSCRHLTGLPLARTQPVATLYDAIHPQDRPILLDRLAHPDDSCFECRLLRPNGSIAPVRVRTFAIAARRSRPFCAGMMEAIAASHEETETERLVNAVATVSHELRTPLTSIVASLALLSGNSVRRLPAPARRLIAIAHTNAERLLRLVTDLLDIETIEQGDAAFERKRADIDALVEQAIDINCAFAERYGVHVRLTAGRGCRAEIDPDRFVQVMTNLLSNAVKFSPPGATVDVAVEAEPGAVSIAVRDRGPGIPAEFKPHVFERFARAATSHPRYGEGSGLGLSIAKEIVARLGGTLTFADAPGGGTLFRVVLPAAAELGAGGGAKEVA